MGLIISSITAQIYLVPEEYICGSTTNNWDYKSLFLRGLSNLAIEIFYYRYS